MIGDASVRRSRGHGAGSCRWRCFVWCRPHHDHHLASRAPSAPRAVFHPFPGPLGPRVPRSRGAAAALLPLWSSWPRPCGPERRPHQPQGRVRPRGLAVRAMGGPTASSRGGGLAFPTRSGRARGNGVAWGPRTSVREAAKGLGRGVRGGVPRGSLATPSPPGRAGPLIPGHRRSCVSRGRGVPPAALIVRSLAVLGHFPRVQGVVSAVVFGVTNGCAGIRCCRVINCCLLYDVAKHLGHAGCRLAPRGAASRASLHGCAGGHRQVPPSVGCSPGAYGCPGSTPSLPAQATIANEGVIDEQGDEWYYKQSSA